MPQGTPNKIKYGLRNVHYAVVTAEANGVLTYDTPVAIPGAVNLSLSPEGEDNPFYADDVVYFSTVANNGYSGTLEMALITDDFKTNVLGEVETSGQYFEFADVIPKEFALFFEFQGDQYPTRHCLLRCTVSRPDVAGATKEESIEPQTETLNIKVLPRINDMAVKVRCPQGATNYSTFFGAVPTISR